jgi:3-deoxy-D-manno-octulosonic-acid transferase
MRILYTLLIRLAVPFAFAVVLWRGWKDPAYRAGRAERFGYGRRLPPGAGSLWLHAVSMGEVAAAAALLRQLRRQFPGLPIIVTTATPTGRARAIALFGAGVDVRFLPYDTPGAVGRFLDAIQPRVGIIMETELWPNLYHACARRELRLVIASARLSERSVRNYRRLGTLIRDLFRGPVWIAAQTDADAARFLAIGADPARTAVIGNVKFDIEIDAEVGARGRALRAALGQGRPVWVAGSTHEGEEEQVLEAHREVLERRADALLVLVPRHPARFDAVAALLARRGVNFVRRSGGGAVAAATQVLLVDSVGELLPFYAAADLAFVGGSLVPIGGHNLLEPAALALPVLTGPSDFNGREIAALLLREGGALRVGDAGELGASILALWADPARRRRMGDAARAVVEGNRGSVARLLALLA